MKTIKVRTLNAGYNTVLVFICLFMLFFTACKKDVASKQQKELALTNRNLALSANSTHLDSLLAYKASKHQLMMGYYRTWGDRWSSGNVSDPIMTQMPDSVDILSVFADYTADTSQFWVQLKNNYIPTLHSKGTRVIFTGGYASSATSATDTAAINTWARGIMANINKYNYDGYDFDIESNDSGTTLAIEKASFAALSQYLGPASGTGKLLIYDTNQNGDALMAAIKNEVNYVFLQAYWRTTATLTSNLATYTSYISKSMLLVGVDFEDGTGEQAGQMPAYTTWAIQNQTGGVFSYGIDNEWFSSHNATTKAAIKAMNPTGAPGGGSSGIVSGATYKIISGVNNTSVLDVTGSGTASGTKVELWGNNSPTSTNQTWIVTSIAGGYYKLQPVNAPATLLDVAGGSNVNGTQIDIATSNGSTAQQWQIAALGGGYYSLSPACASSSLLDIYGSQTTNGTKVEIWSSNGGSSNQKFKFVQQ